MTKDKSHRQLFVSKVLNDHFSVKDAAIHNTGRNWMRMPNRIGNYYPLRHRRSIPGVMSLDHQEILQMVISNNRMAMIDEITQSMSEETGFHYSPRLIRQVMSRHKYVSRLANELSPLERDNELRRYYREQVMHPGGNFTSTQLVFQKFSRLASDSKSSILNIVSRLSSMKSSVSFLNAAGKISTWPLFL